MTVPWGYKMINGVINCALFVGWEHLISTSWRALLPNCSSTLWISKLCADQKFLVVNCTRIDAELLGAHLIVKLQNMKIFISDVQKHVKASA
jgi:hypothetical protein